MVEDWTENIIRQWQTEKIELNPGVSIDTLMLTEKTLDFTFPDQFKELYLKVNGFTDNNWTRNMFIIWPIERIIEEYGSNNDKNFIGFSDYFINSHQIGFTKNEKGIFKYHNKPELIADKFGQAIELINMDSESIYI